MYKLVNIKEGMPNSDYAIYLLEKEIEFAKKEGTRVIVFVHGYGSKGYGGVIKSEVDIALSNLKRNKKIVTYVSGDKWTETNIDVKLICSISPELTISSQVRNINSGVTIVLVY